MIKWIVIGAAIACFLVGLFTFLVVGDDAQKFAGERLGELWIKLWQQVGKLFSLFQD